jgi:hypothetical protein
MTGVRYSDAPRCADCHGRALLSEEAADTLVQESKGRLETFACLAGDGWHVWRPDLEHTPPRSDSSDN